MTNVESRDIETALLALHVAARVIAALPGVANASADNDNDSGEIVFTTDGGSVYVLTLKDVSTVSGDA